MMNKWHLKFLLKIGKVIAVTYKGPETCSDDIMKRFIDGPACNFFCVPVEENGHDLWISRGEIAALEIIALGTVTTAFRPNIIKE